MHNMRENPRKQKEIPLILQSFTKKYHYDGKNHPYLEKQQSTTTPNRLTKVNFVSIPNRKQSFANVTLFLRLVH